MSDPWTFRNFHHKYVELHVRAAERVPYLRYTYVAFPRWYQRAWNMPDSVVRGGKPLAYHVGHYSAILSIAVPVLALVL